MRADLIGGTTLAFLFAVLSWWLPTVSVAQDAVRAGKTVGTRNKGRGRGVFLREPAMRVRLVGLVMAFGIWSVEMAPAQIGVALGPKDSAGLPPTDLSRVVIDRQGIVRWKFVEVDYRVRASNEQILDALARLRG